MKNSKKNRVLKIEVQWGQTTIPMELEVDGSIKSISTNVIPKYTEEEYSKIFTDFSYRTQVQQMRGEEKREVDRKAI